MDHQVQGDLGGFVDRVIAEIQGHVLNIEIVEPIIIPTKMPHFALGSPLTRRKKPNIGMRSIRPDR
jgi:hypothetical protein